MNGRCGKSQNNTVKRIFEENCRGLVLLIIPWIFVKKPEKV